MPAFYCVDRNNKGGLYDPKIRGGVQAAYALTESTSATELLDKKGNLSFSVMLIASTEMFQVTV
jgi:hypothetical protein